VADAVANISRIMPAAMVPRPWDFASLPNPVTGPDDAATEPTVSVDMPGASQGTNATSRSSGSRPSDSYSSDMIVGAVPIQISLLPPVLPDMNLSPPNGTANPLSV